MAHLIFFILRGLGPRLHLLSTHFLRCNKSRHYLVPFSSIFGVIGVIALDGEAFIKCGSVTSPVTL